MEPTERFGLIEGSTNGEQRSWLTVDGTQTNTRLQGRRIEAEFRVRAGYLLIISDDCPYEEILNIYLLDADLNALDHIEMGAPYTPGLFEVVGADQKTLRFRFDDDQAYELVVQDQPQWSLKRLPPTARRRRLWPKHYLDLRQVGARGATV